jgi:phytoene dehydrogenase-like protein
VSSRRYDAVVVGGGHNGLVAAFYLARAGLSTVVLERRPFVGGACVTEEFAPGFRASTGAYVLSMLRERIWRDMRLVERGVRVDPAGPSMHVFPDGALLSVDDDMEPTLDELARFSKADAQAYPAFEGRLASIAAAVSPVFDWPPPDPATRSARGLLNLTRYGRLMTANRRLLEEAAFLFTTSASRLLDERFESEHVKAAIGWHAINDSLQGPSAPGTAYVLLHDHAADASGPAARQWGFIRGGVGFLTAKMADAVREAGGEVRTDAEVERILVEGGAATGVALANGEVVGGARVLSNADPKRTFLRLVDEADQPASFVDRIRAYRCDGTSMKINLGVDRLPELRGLPGGVQPYHRGIMEFTSTLEEMDRDQALARQGVAVEDSHVEVCFPTVHDVSLAPPGSHILTIDVNSQPYEVRDGWDAIKDRRADQVVAQLERYFPGLSASILHRQVLSPLDLERVLGITGGHALHGEMTPDQLLFMRPVRGWANYRTPVRGLYLCGAGTHPGGGVTGANGRNAARELLRDLRRPRSRRRGRSHR